MRRFETTGTSRIADEDMAREYRKLVIAHSYEAFALWGLRLATQRNLSLPSSHFFGYDLAPARLEGGVRYIQNKELKDPGLDIVMTMNPKNICLPRYPLLGINVKASKGPENSTLLWYSPRISALAINLNVGRWNISDDGQEILHHRYKEALKSDRGTRQLLAFMERNIEPFGGFLLQQVADGVSLARGRMMNKYIEDWGQNIRMLPGEGEARDRLFSQVSQLCSVFEASGIQPTWRHHYPPENVIQRQFLPTTPLQ